MIPREVLVKMATIGLSAEQADAVSEMLCMVETATEAVVEKSREKTRARVAKWRETHAGNAKERHVTLPNVTERLTGGDARGEDKPLPQKIEPQESKKEQVATSAKRDADAFKAELATDLDPEVLDSFVRVRRNKRGALTGFAARLFREDAAKCGLSVPEAATECVRSSWITVKPEYFDNRPRGSPKAPQLSEVFNLIGQRAADEQQRETAKGSSGSRPAIPDLSIVRTG
jgi:hypothetical protein